MSVRFAEPEPHGGGGSGGRPHTSGPDPRLIVPRSGHYNGSEDADASGSASMGSSATGSSAGSSSRGAGFGDQLRRMATSRGGTSPEKPPRAIVTHEAVGLDSPAPKATPGSSNRASGTSKQQQTHNVPELRIDGPEEDEPEAVRASTDTVRVNREDVALVAIDWRQSVVESCLQPAILDQTREQVQADFDSLERTDADTVVFRDGYEREIELDFNEFVIFKAISSDPKFVFVNLRLAFQIMDSTGQEQVLRADFVKYAPLLNVCDVISAGKIFDCLAAKESRDGVEPVLLFAEFEKYVVALRKGYRVNKKWEDLKAKLHFDPAEVLLQHSSGVADHTDFALGHPGLLFLSNQHVYLESTILRRGKIMDLGSIASVHKKKIGIFGVDNGIEIVGEDPASKHVIVSFNKDRDRWFSYLEEMVFVHRKARELEEASMAAADDGSGSGASSSSNSNNHSHNAANTINYLIDVATHNIIRAKAIHKATGNTNVDYFLCKSMNRDGRLQSGAGAAADMMWSYKLFRGFLSNFTESQDIATEEEAESADEPFQYKRFIGNIDRLILLLDPVFQVFSYISGVFTWKAVSTSLLYLLLCLYAVYNDLLGYAGVLLCLANAALVGWWGFLDYLERDQLRVARQPGDKPPEVAGKDKTSVFTILRVIQNTVGDINVVLIKIRNLYVWQVPWMSKVFFGALFLLALVLLFVPFRYIFFLVVLEGFTLNNLFNRFPRFKDNYDVVGRFWSQIPATYEELDRPKQS